MGSGPRAESQWHCSLLDPSHTDSATSQQRGLRCTALAPPPYKFTGALKQRNMAQMKEQIKPPEKELSNEEIANLSDAELKTLVIRMLTEMVEYSCKIEEKVRAMKSEIKENAQGTKSDGKETGTQVNGWEQKEEINIQA